MSDLTVPLPRRLRAVAPRLLAGLAVVGAAVAALGHPAGGVGGTAAVRPAAPATTVAMLRSRGVVPGPLHVTAAATRSDGVVVEHVDYHADGLLLTGTLLLPAGSGRHPVALALHGLIRPQDYHPGDDAEVLADPLVRRGVAVAVPDYRAHGGSDPDPLDMALPLADALDSWQLLADVLAQPWADASRVGVVGHSLGANVGEILLAVEPRVHAALLLAPSEGDAAVLQHRRPSFYAGRPGVATPETQPALYAALGPTTSLGALAGTSVRIVHGTADRVIPPGGSVAAVARLRAAGARADLVLLDGQGHALDGPAWQRALAAGTDFLLQTL